MIKKIITLFIAGISIGLLSSFVIGQHTALNTNPDIVDVDLDSSIDLDFTGVGVRIEGWDKNFVQISSISPMVENKDENYQSSKYKISVKKNSISLKEYSKTNSVVYNLQTWLPLVQFEKYKDQIHDMNGLNVGMSTISTDYSFLINVPKDTPLRITADRIKTFNCTLVYTNARTATLKVSTIIKGFVSEGSAITVRDCTVNNDSSFKNKTLEMKNNKYVPD